jgi:hypothetical protein
MASARGGTEMPDVLEYASPATPKRRRWHADLDLVFVSLLQIGMWLWEATKSFYREPVPGDQHSFFAFVWRYDQSPLVAIVFGVVTSLAIWITAFRSYQKRVFWYRAYVIALVLGPILNFIPHAYLLSQLPGAWGSLLLHREAPDDFPIDVIYCLQPVVWLLLVRALSPKNFIEGHSNDQ